MPSSETIEAHPAGLKARKRVLIIHPDESETERISGALEKAGWLAYTRREIPQALAAAYDEPPDMLIIDRNCKPNGGAPLCVELKLDSLFAHLPILMTVPAGVFGPETVWDDCPIDDFLCAPFSVEDLLIRVALCSARAGRTLDANPLTRLPGNNSIIREVEARLASGERFAVAYLDIDNFKSFNDRYGFARGDEALRLTARLMTNAVHSNSSGGPFVGHVGGDDYVFIAAADDMPKICETLIQNFDLVIKSLYDEEDRIRGYIDSVNRRGEGERFPIMTLSISVASNARGALAHYGQVSSIVSEIKKKLKTEAKSNYLIDRRIPPNN